MVRLFFDGGSSSVVGCRASSREGRSSSIVTTISITGFGLGEVPLAGLPRSGTLRTRGSHAVSCMKLGFLERRQDMRITVCWTVRYGGRQVLTAMKALMVKSSVKEEIFWSWLLSCARRDIISSSAELRMARVLTAGVTLSIRKGGGKDTVKIMAHQ